MGNKSTEKKNKLLDKQTSRSQGFQDEMAGYGREDRGYNVTSRSDINSKYNDLYSSLDEEGYGGGGGGGEVYTPQYADAIENAYAGDYRDWANTGGFTTEGMQDYRSRATATLPAMYSGLSDQLTTANNRAGGNVGFNSQMAKLAREKAYGANQVASNAEADLQDRIRSGKQWGISGGSGLDESLIGRKMQIERERQAAAASAAAQRNANANRGRASAEEGFRNRMAILEAQRGLRGEAGSDLPYFNAAGAFGNQAANTIGGRETEPGFWDRAQGIIQSGVGAAAGAFMPSGGFRPKKPIVYGPGPGPDGQY